MRRRPRPRDHRRLPRDSSTPIANCRGSCFFRSRTEIALEVLALRQQMGVLKRKRPRPRLSPLDRLFWTVLRTTWSHWRDALVIVKPETVVGWHRAGFRLYWRWKSGSVANSGGGRQGDRLRTSIDHARMPSTFR